MLSPPSSPRFSKGKKGNRIYRKQDELQLVDIVLSPPPYDFSRPGDAIFRDLVNVIDMDGTTSDLKKAQRIVNELTLGSRFWVPCDPPSHATDQDQEGAQWYYLPTQQDAKDEVQAVIREKHRIFKYHETVRSSYVKVGRQFKTNPRNLRNPRNGNERLKKFVLERCEEYHRYGTGHTKKTALIRATLDDMRVDNTEVLFVKPVPETKPKKGKGAKWYGVLEEEEEHEVTRGRFDASCSATQKKRKENDANRKAEEKKNGNSGEEEKTKRKKM